MNKEILYEEAETKEALETIKAMLTEMDEIKQNRSTYVLEHFVVGTHDMPGRQRLQILDELESLFFATLDMIDDRSLAIIDRDKALAPDANRDEWEEEKDKVRARKYERLAASLAMQINSRTREIQALLKMLQELPQYTREELEAEEKEYWVRRLSRQAWMSQRGATTGLGEGNLDLLITLDKKLGKKNTLPMMTREDMLAIIAPPTQAPPPQPLTQPKKNYHRH